MSDGTRNGRSDEYFKVPELLPIFKNENEDPEAFVDDFNAVLECIDEPSDVKVVLWFKNRVRIPLSSWDAELSPNRDSLHAYQRAFLKYFWSTSAQRLAVEHFEQAKLDFKSEISISRQILNFYSKMKRVRSEPMPDSKFKREIVRKLPLAMRGHFICDNYSYFYTCSRPRASAASACNWASYHTFNVMVFKYRHYTTCITLHILQTGCTLAFQLGFEPDSLVWQASSLPIKPSSPAERDLIKSFL